jgi:hypothetical protein
METSEKSAFRSLITEISGLFQKSQWEIIAGYPHSQLRIPPRPSPCLHTEVRYSTQAWFPAQADENLSGFYSNLLHLTRSRITGFSKKKILDKYLIL